VVLEHGDGTRMLPILFQGHDEFAEHPRRVRRQFQRVCQWPDSQVTGPALHARVTELIQRPRVRRSGVFPALCHRRSGLRQVIEPGEPRGSCHQSRHLAQRQRLAVRPQTPEQTRDVARRQQAPCPL
jgi:hypothetical protein